MHLLSPRHYEFWRALGTSNARRFYRVWLDGLYSGTHPSWQFQRLSPRALSELWEYFYNCRPREYTGRQLRAVKHLAQSFAHVGRRADGAIPAGQQSPPRSIRRGGDAWERYFADLGSTDSSSVAPNVEQAADLLNRPDVAGWDSVVWNAADLASALLAHGLARRELMVRVIESTRLVGRPPDPRSDLGRFLLRCFTPTTAAQSFVVWTNLLSTHEISRSFARRELSVSSVETLGFSPTHEEAITFVQIENRVVAISRHARSHSERAVIDHRMRVLEALARAPRAESRLHLAPQSFARLSEEVAQSESLSSEEEVRNSLLRTVPRATALASEVEQALRMLRDRPHRAIKDLSDRCEHELGGGWPSSLARRYAASLPTVQRRHVAAHLLRLSHVWEKGAQGMEPKWIRALIELRATKGFLAFDEVASELKSDPDGADDLLGFRLRDVAQSAGPRRAQTVESLFCVARGMRDAVTHSGELELEQRIPLYIRQRLLLLMLHAYVAGL